MPRFVRPSWVEVIIEGRKRFASGPRTKSGTMLVQFLVRGEGSVTDSVQIGCHVIGSSHVLTVYDESGKVIHTHVTKLD